MLLGGVDAMLKQNRNFGNRRRW